MRPLTQALLCLFSTLIVAQPLAAVDQIVLFPAGNATQLPVLRAADLSLAGSIAAPSSSFAVIQSLDGQKYYVVTRQLTPSIIVVSANTLQTIKTIDLGGSVNEAALSPDGKYLLAATGQLRIVDTATDVATKTLDVGGAPTKILFDDAAKTAFVLANSGRTLSAVDMASLAVTDSETVPNAQDMALTRNSSRLVLSFNSGVRQYRPRDFSEISFIPTDETLVNSVVHPLPSGAKAVIENQGGVQSRTAQLVDLDLSTTTDIGNIGQTQLRQVQIFDGTRAYAIDLSSNEVVSLDLTATPDVTVTPLPFGSDVRTISLSPSRRTLHVSSRVDASILTVDTATNTVTRSMSLSVAPDSHALLFGPSQSGPGSITINGGNKQYYPPDTTLPVPLSVEVTDSQGRPVPNVPVLFDDPFDKGLIISPQQPSFTNSRGVASATVKLPPAPAAPVDPDGEGPEEPAALPELEALTVSASAAGLSPVLFDVNVVHGTGPIKVSGNHQGVNEGSPFLLPLVILATDQSGFPLPPGKEVNIGTSFASCGPGETDGSGFVVLGNCSAFRIRSDSGQFFEKGNVTPSYFTSDDRQVLTAFEFVVIRSGRNLTFTPTSGDGQTGRSGEELPIPLGFTIGNSSLQGGTLLPFNVELTQLSGPPVILEKRNVLAQMFRDEKVKVRLGESAGTAVIQARASIPGLPTATYTIKVEGGRAVSLRKAGDGQSGKIATNLASPLEVRVVNETGTLVPSPEVTWRVTQGDATLTTSTGSDYSRAVVLLGTTPGPVRVTAAVGTLQTEFNVTALPPAPASISTFAGQNQTLTSGVLSQTLVVRVSELDNRPAVGAVITFAGPPNVRLHPADGSTPGNPVQVVADQAGLAGVKAELVAVSALGEEDGASQIAQTVTITATAGSQLSTSFLLNVVGRTPSFSVQGVVNAADGQSQGVVPGGLATIYGVGLMEGIVGVANPGGQTSFQGTIVRIGGRPVPLLALSAGPPEQINVQVPFELTTGQTTTVEIENNGSRLTIGGVPVFPAQPGIFEDRPATGPSFAAAVHHNDGSLITAENPARPGEVISLFATGAGRVEPPVPTGTLGPALPLSLVTLPVVVGIDDKGSEVLFKGYAPGFLGLYQFNLVVPPDARCGQRGVSLKVGDSFSKNSSIAIRCP